MEWLQGLKIPEDASCILTGEQAEDDTEGSVTLTPKPIQRRDNGVYRVRIVSPIKPQFSAFCLHATRQGALSYSLQSRWPGSIKHALCDRRL